MTKYTYLVKKIKKQWNWVSGLGKLNKVFLALGSLSVILAVIFGVPALISFWTDSNACLEEDYSYCKQILEEYQKEKFSNVGDSELFDYKLKEKFGLDKSQIENLAKNFEQYALSEYDKGLASGAIGNYQEALVHFDNAIELDSTNANAYYSKGATLAFLERYSEAIETMDLAQKYYGGVTIDLLNVKAKSYAALGDFNNAIAQYQIAITIQPENSDLWNDLGITYAQNEDYYYAMKAFDKALEIGDSDDVITLANIGNVLIFQRKFFEASLIYTKIIEEAPEYQKAYDNRGSSYFKIGFMQQALEDWEKALELDGNNPFACRVSNVGNGHLAIGDTKKAQEYYNQAETLDPNYLQNCYRKSI